MAVKAFRSSLVLVVAAAACGPVPVAPSAPAPATVAPSPAPAATADTIPTQSLESIRVVVETRVTGTRRDTLSTRVTLTNRGTVPVLVYHADCVVELRAYRGPEPAGQPVWRSSRVDHVCLDYLEQKTVGPGESYSPRQLGVRVPVQRVLGDSLPPGRYSFEAEVRLVDASRTPQGHHRFDLSAGEADLRRP
jgi:hypothetical protein